MNFDLSGEQSLVKDAAERFLRDAYGFDARRRILETDDGFSRDIWRSIGELGWLGLPISEANGGMGGDAVDVMVLAEAMGRALVVEPWLASVLLAGRLIDRLGTPAQIEEILAPMLAGRTVLGFAHMEAQARYDLADVRTTARRDHDGWTLEGAKIFSVAAPLSAWIVVSARSGGGATDRDGISLFLVDKNQPGISTRSYRTVDGRSAADIVLAGVRLPAGALLGPADAALPAIEDAVTAATVTLCAEAVGAMERSNEITVEYLKTREQFGQKIGKFQALQHRMVDLFMEAELSRSITIAATLKLQERAPDAARMISAAKAKIGNAGRLIGTQSVQLHGGMGMSQEYPIGHYYRRLIAIDSMFGNTAWHRARMSAATPA